MHKRYVLDFEIRNKIYNFILKHPGLHQRDLSRKMNIPKTTLSYHLRFLEKRDLIVAKYDKSHHRYYTIENGGALDKKVINFLRQDIPCNIILYMLVTIIASRQELSRSLEKPPNTISFHLNNLIDAEILEICPVGNGVVYRSSKVNTRIIERSPVTKEIFYRIKDRGAIYDVLIKNKNSLNENNLFKSIMYYLEKECSSYWPLPKKMKDRNASSNIESIEKAIYEVFPHPYYV